jgi:chemotaxis protein MotC
LSRSAAVASGSVGAVATQLKSIDRKSLSESDQLLLDAARAVAHEVIAPPNAPNVPAESAMAVQSPPPPKSPPDPAVGKLAGPDVAALEASGKTVSDARRKLAAIDELLKETE